MYIDVIGNEGELAMKDKEITDLFSAWEKLSQTPEKMIAYHSYFKTIIDEEARLDSAVYYGIKQSIEQGIKKGSELKAKEVARKLIAKGASNEDIHELTELSYEEIKRMCEEMGDSVKTK